MYFLKIDPILIINIPNLYPHFTFSKDHNILLGNIWLKQFWREEIIDRNSTSPMTRFDYVSVDLTFSVYFKTLILVLEKEFQCITNLNNYG